MPSLLLISSADALVEALDRVLPVSVPLVRLSTSDEAKSYLQSLGCDESGQMLILLDATPGKDAVAACRQLHQDGLIGSVPIIAIIAQAADRQVILEAGADDYLLLPLLPSEVEARLVAYTPSPLGGLNALIEAIGPMPGQSPLSHLQDQGVKSLAEQFKAQSAWLLLAEPGQEAIRLVGSYNLPPLLVQQDTAFVREALSYLDNLRQRAASLPQVIDRSHLTQTQLQLTGGLTHYLCIPLNGDRGPVGVLTLGYTACPRISPAERQMLAMLGRSVGALLDMASRLEETQIYATQTAFMMLVARIIGERMDLNTILSLTLEQATSLLNASSGEIWLLSADGRQLELVSSLSSSLFSDHRPTRLTKGQGLIGWVAEHDALVYLTSPAADPRFDPQADQSRSGAEYVLLAIPLRHSEATVGVLAIHNEPPHPFNDRDTILAEGIASLAASAIIHARLVQDLRTHADQQQALYEMSRHIAAGLDLEATLNYTLYWVNRLFDVEISLLWLVEQAQSNLYLAAALGVELPQARPFTIPVGQGIIGWIARHAETVISNDVPSDPRFDPFISRALNIVPHNIIAVPVIYHDQVIGVLNLSNKLTGPFEERDLTLLSTAVEIIAVAVGNARLHAQVVDLLEERERLHKQILHSERLATVGRLTASLSHEINNPMQAIRGALTLALEELDNPQDLTNYLRLSLQESERVVRLTNRMRHIYRPQTDVPEAVDLNQVLREAVAIAGKELKQQNVTLHVNLAPEVPPITAVAGQLHLVFLSYVLNLGDMIGATGGGQLQLRSLALPKGVRVEFLTDLPAVTMTDWMRAAEPPAAQDEGMYANFISSLSHGIIRAHGGAINLSQQATHVVLSIDFPLSPPAS